MSSKECFETRPSPISPCFDRISTLILFRSNVAKASFSPIPNFPITSGLFSFSGFSLWMRSWYRSPRPKSRIVHHPASSFATFGEADFVNTDSSIAFAINSRIAWGNSQLSRILSMFKSKFLTTKLLNVGCFTVDMFLLTPNSILFYKQIHSDAEFSFFSPKAIRLPPPKLRTSSHTASSEGSGLHLRLTMLPITFFNHSLCFLGGRSFSPTAQVLRAHGLSK